MAKSTMRKAKLAIFDQSAKYGVMYVFLSAPIARVIISVSNVRGLLLLFGYRRRYTLLFVGWCVASFLTQVRNVLEPIEILRPF